MVQCDISGALKYIEGIYNQISEDKTKKDDKKVIKKIFDDINKDRAALQQASSFAGDERININEPFSIVDFEPTPVPSTAKVRAKSRTFGDVVAYFYPKGSKELKESLAFTRYDDKGTPYIIMQEGITAAQVLDYIQGKISNSLSSAQKSVVNEHMKFTYGIDLVAAIEGMSDSDVRTFIIKHELSHIANSDKTSYYKDTNQSIATSLNKADMSNKLLSDSAIEIEARANIEALNNSLKTVVSGKKVTTTEDVTFNDTTVDVIEPEAESNSPGYPITGNLKTNPGQTKAIDTMIGWFKQSKAMSFLLQGRGGTGKTTVINVLLRELGVKPGDVMFAAPTNKAKKVIAEANKGTDYARSSYLTVAQILGIKPTTDEDGIQHFKEDLYAKKPSIPKVLIVDEASMLHSDNYEALTKRAKMYGSRIIFMGDNAQLPPIGDRKATIKSVVFEDTKDNTATLTELMRQEKGSSIINLTSKLIRVVNRVESFLASPHNTVEKAKQRLLNVLFDGNEFTDIDRQKNEGLIITDETFGDVLPSFIRDYLKNPKGTKYIGYNNHVHTATIQKVNAIRKALFGEKASIEAFIPGEPLVLNSSYTVDMGTDDSVLLDNGEEFIVESSIKTKKRITYYVGKQSITTAKPIEVYEINAKDLVTGTTYTFDKPVGSVSEVKAFIEEEKANTVAHGVKPGGAYRLLDALAQGLSYGYVINSHKAQGSTYDTVYLDLGNIAGQRLSSANDIIKSLYVGASRPRKKLVVMDNRGPNGQIVNPSKVTDAESKPEVFENIDNAEANDIIDKVNKCKSKG